jgi:hypothetical protein
MKMGTLTFARAVLALPLALASVAAQLVPPPGAAASVAPNALIGSWQFDPTGSSFVGGVPYRSGSAMFTIARQCMQVVVDIVEITGAALHFEYCDVGNGSYVTVTGNPFYDNESTTWIDRLTARRTERRGQSVTGTTMFKVAPDGRSYVTTASRTRPDGQLYTSVIHWKRIT